jgi:hypothetical protein
VNCPNVTTRLTFENGEFEEKPVAHAVAGIGVVTCKLCSTSWCCLECAVECNAIDHAHFDAISEAEETPAVFGIICCACSGNRPSWTDRD